MEFLVDFINASHSLILKYLNLTLLFYLIRQFNGFIKNFCSYSATKSKSHKETQRKAKKSKEKELSSNTLDRCNRF